MRTTGAILLVSASLAVAAQDKITKLDFPTSLVGHFEASDEPTPLTIDRKGGMIDRYRITVDKEGDFYARAECDACVVRLGLMVEGEQKPGAQDTGMSVQIGRVLQPGSYILFVATGPEQFSAYTLRTSNSGLAPEMKIFSNGYQVQWMNRGKISKNYVRVRLGIEAISFTFSADGHFFRQYKYADITSLEASAQTTDHRAAGMLLGPGFGGVSSESFITIKTNEDFVILSVPPSNTQMVLTLLQQATKKKSPTQETPIQ